VVVVVAPEAPGAVVVVEPEVGRVVVVVEPEVGRVVVVVEPEVGRVVVVVEPEVGRVVVVVEPEVGRVVVVVEPEVGRVVVVVVAGGAVVVVVVTGTTVGAGAWDAGDRVEVPVVSSGGKVSDRAPSPTNSAAISTVDRRIRRRGEIGRPRKPCTPLGSAAGAVPEAEATTAAIVPVVRVIRLP
jgi:hypothetical protein